MGITAHIAFFEIFQKQYISYIYFISNSVIFGATKNLPLFHTNILNKIQYLYLQPVFRGEISFMNLPQIRKNLISKLNLAQINQFASEVVRFIDSFFF